MPTPLLGMQSSLKNDLPLIRFFGLASTEKVADIAFAKTAPGTPRTPAPPPSPTAGSTTTCKP